MDSALTEFEPDIVIFENAERRDRSGVMITLADKISSSN